MRTVVDHWKGKILGTGDTDQGVYFFAMLSVHTEVCKRLGDVRALQNKWENKRKQECFNLWRMATETKRAMIENQIASNVNKVHTTHSVTNTRYIMYQIRQQEIIYIVAVAATAEKVLCAMERVL